MMPINVVIYSDYICPFCFLANTIIKRIKENYPLKIMWKPFELHPYGIMVDLNSEYIKRVWRNVQLFAKENEIEIKLPKFLSISRKALETAEFARDNNKFDECHDMIFNAYFLEGKNIEKEQVLINIVKNLGLNSNEIRKNWKNGSYSKIIDNSIHELHSMGITGVPTFIIGNENTRTIFGVYPQDKIERVIEKVIHE
ncbi:MAG: DsbA family oxidoreductase [Candidatus Helarchaeota archaeon]